MSQVICKDGTQSTLDAVACHGVAHPFADHESESAMGHIVVQAAHYQFRASPTLPRFSHSCKGTGIPQTVPPFHGEKSDCLRCSVFDLAMCQLHSNMFPPAQAPTFQDFAAPRGPHALTEAMRPQPLSYFGLPSSFGHDLHLLPNRLGLALPAKLFQNSRSL